MTNHPNRSRRAKLVHIERKLKAAGIHGAVATFIPADDHSVDDEIEIKIAGVAASVSMQVGGGYYGVNRYLFVNGEIDGLEHLYMGGDFETAACRLVAAIAA